MVKEVVTWYLQLHGCLDVENSFEETLKQGHTVWRHKMVGVEWLCNILALNVLLVVLLNNYLLDSMTDSS